ncbi:MAG: radical SAM protein [Candidatus Aminicenantes bacterium]|nr:radical SAM protein [Candidatus Aminicenantes bacterium]
MKGLSYWKRLARLFYHYRKKSPHLPYLPIRLWVELTSHCNYRCVMCPNKDLSKENKGHMEFGLYKKIIDEAKEFVFDINLAHRGESLLHPQLVEAIHYAKNAGLFTRLHTNGSLLNEELARQIVESELDRLSFSFDGFNQETYESIRVGGDFEKTINNITRFLEIKKQAGSQKPETAIEVINFDKLSGPEFIQARENFRRRFAGLPLDSFIMKELHNWAGEIDKDTRRDDYTACPFPWNALVIFWDGAVLPCTQDFFGHYLVGNVKDESLQQIWNGQKLKHLREKLATGELKEFETCANCDRVWRKGLFGVPKEYLWKFLTKKMP